MNRRRALLMALMPLLPFAQNSHNGTLRFLVQEKQDLRIHFGNITAVVFTDGETEVRMTPKEIMEALRG